VCRDQNNNDEPIQATRTALRSVPATLGVPRERGIRYRTTNYRRGVYPRWKIRCRGVSIGIARVRLAGIGSTANDQDFRIESALRRIFAERETPRRRRRQSVRGRDRRSLFLASGRAFDNVR